MKTEIFVSEQGRSNEALREVEDRYRRLLAATTDYVYTVSIENGNSGSTYHGPGCEAVTGYSQADFAKDPYLWYEIIHEEDRAGVLSHTQMVLHGETPRPLEHRIICRDGSVRWIRNTPIPHRNGGGRLVAYDGLISDITERKRSEEALRESQERLSLVILGSNDGIWDWDLKTDKTYFSPRWKTMLGYEDREIENTFAAWEGLIHPDDLNAARAQLRSYLAGEVPVYELEHRLRHKDGSYRWILARGVAQRDSSGRPVRMAGSHMDLTQLKNASERLKQANQELQDTQNHLVQAARFESIGTLAAGVAHEVKNPLQTMLMGLHYLTQKLPNPGPEVSLTLNDMREAVTRANLVINELLTLSRVTPFEMRHGNLNELMAHCLRLLRTQLDTAGVAAVLRLEEGLPEANIDTARMEQVFVNLLINAIQAMPGGGDLFVTTRSAVLENQPRSINYLFRKFGSARKLVVAEVRDTGCGIKPADLPRIFDPFFTTKAVGVGTGLGLSLARMIVDRHGGVIDVRNAVEGGVVATVALAAVQGRDDATQENTGGG